MIIFYCHFHLTIYKAVSYYQLWFYDNGNSKVTQNKLQHIFLQMHQMSVRKILMQTVTFTLAILPALIAITSINVYADSNVLGDEITVYADEEYTYTPIKPSTLNSEIDASNSRLNDNKQYLSDDGSSPILSTTIQNKINKNTGNKDVDSMVSQQNEDLWQRIKNGYAIPNSASALIVNHENWYSSRPDYMKRMIERSQKYLFHIVEEVEKRGMPTEIALLPMIESGYNPQAYSRSHASGIWQFIPSTGKHFGLKQNWWVDNRRDVTAATNAALDYLQKLHGMFGAWNLALAAYNAGEGTVSRAIERNRKLGLSTDYENLQLSDETKNYVPKLQAIKNLMTNPSDYGIEIQTIANTAYFSTVKAPAQIDAHLAAKFAEISDDEFLALNPSYNRPVITNNSKKDDAHDLLLPIKNIQTFQDNLANNNKPLSIWQTYVTKRGELMTSIAKKFGIQLAQLRNVNDLPSNKKIKKSSTILVPNTLVNNGNDINSANSANAEMNNLVGIEPKAKTNVRIAGKTVNKSSNKKKTYIVKRGDTLHSIAQQFSVDVDDIKRWNKALTSRIQPGHRITILSSEA